MLALGTAAVGAHLYLAAHPDLASPPLRWLATLYDVGVWAFLLILALALGLRLHAALGPRRAPRLEQAIYGLGSGLAVLSLAHSALAFAGLAWEPLILVLLAAATVVVRHDLWRLAHHLERLWSRRPWLPARPGAGYLGLLVAIAAAGNLEVLLLALGPPLGYDALQYHMAVPRWLLETHHLPVIPTLQQVNLPMGLEILFVPCLALGSDVAAHLLAYCFAPLTALAVLMIGRRVAGPVAGVLGAVIFLLQPAVLVTSGRVGAEGGLAFFCALAAGAVLRALDAARGEDGDARAWLGLAGLYAGMSLSIKYTALAMVAMVVATALLAPRMAALSAVGSRIRAVLTVGLAALVVGCPWYVKNGLALGNPFYPFDFGRLVRAAGQGLATRPVAPAGGARAGTVVGSVASAPGHSLADLLRLPFDLLVHQEAFTQMYPSVMFPLCILALPIALVRGPRALRLLALYAVGGLLFWALGPWELRYGFPAFPALSIVGGVVCAVAIQKAGRAMRALLYQLLIALSALALLAATQGVISDHHLRPLMEKAPFAYLLGVQSRTGYIAANVDQYATVAWMNAHLPPDAPIAYFWDERSYYSAARHIIFLPRGIAFPPPFASERAARAWIARFGAQYLFLDRFLLGYYVRAYGADPAIHAYFSHQFDPFARRYLRLLYDGGDFKVYRILTH